MAIPGPPRFSDYCMYCFPNESVVARRITGRPNQGLRTFLRPVVLDDAPRAKRRANIQQSPSEIAHIWEAHGAPNRLLVEIGFL